MAAVRVSSERRAQRNWRWAEAMREQRLARPCLLPSLAGCAPLATYSLASYCEPPFPCSLRALALVNAGAVAAGQPKRRIMSAPCPQSIPRFGLSCPFAAHYWLALLLLLIELRKLQRALALAPSSRLRAPSSPVSLLPCLASSLSAVLLPPHFDARSHILPQTVGSCYLQRTLISISV